MNRNALAFISAAESIFGPTPRLSRADIQRVVNEKNVPMPYWLTSNASYRADRGMYQLPNVNESVIEPVIPEPASPTIHMAAQILSLRQPKLVDDSDSSVPEAHVGYVPFGFYKDLKHVIRSKTFYPTFITGLSGNGKTMMVEQVCADLGREMIRFQVSPETDESDLLGGYSLIDGNTVYRDGPVVVAMKRGAVLLIDEVDRGSNKLMCLQGIMEGKPYYNKKNGELVKPKNGFTIIATANTKGRGSDEGKYLAQILDDAFLERFCITVEQEYPDAKTEKKILSALIDDVKFVDNLVKWADVVRQSYDQAATDEIISTRRLVHIAGAYKIFGDRMKAIQLCVNRCDAETKTAFLDLYTKVDADVGVPPGLYTNVGVSVPDNDPDQPF